MSNPPTPIDRLLVFGGETAHECKLNDVWEFDMNVSEGGEVGGKHGVFAASPTQTSMQLSTAPPCGVLQTLKFVQLSPPEFCKKSCSRLFGS